MFQGKIREFADRVDNAMRIGTRCTGESDRILVNKWPYCFHVCLEICINGNTDDFHIHVMGSLQKSGMNCIRRNNFRLLDSLFVPSPFPVDIHGVINAFCSSRRDNTTGFIIRVGFRHLVAVEHFRNHRNDLSFEFRTAGAHVTL